MKTVANYWTRWIAKLNGPPLCMTEAQSRGELFTPDQLGRHAKALAASHHVGSHVGPDVLLSRLEKNEAVIRTFNGIILSLDKTRRITPAAEWLIDNFYIIEEQIQMARLHLPKGYSRELPRLIDGHYAGLPRVYDIVIELIAHTDAQIDVGSLTAFVASYQSVVSLKLGELWAIPIMCRLSLIDNLQCITSRLIVARQERDLAHSWVERLHEMAKMNPSQLIVVVAEMAKSDIPLTSSFVAEFCQCLSQHSTELYFARTWLEQQLANHGLSVEQLIHRESQMLAADQVSVSHCIASLRLLGAIDWKDFVESLSLVEATLRTDPAGIYATMDFATRDRYRHVVEAVARYGEMGEADVARKAVDLAAAASRGTEPRAQMAHVGFYLVDKGMPALERAVRVSWPWRTMIERGIQRFPFTFYTGGIALLSLLGAFFYFQKARPFFAEEWMLVCFTVVFLICASQFAVAIMNWLAGLLVSPRVLPRLDYSAGIAADCRTMVVVPSMLTSDDGVDHLIEVVEIHYLANRDLRIHFALLTDFRDAASENQPEDEELQERARKGIAALNEKYPSAEHTIFFLFHRPRRWNESEGVWMGYERKRGKLTEFNALLRGGSREAFSVIEGDTDILPQIKYVITLDTDTHLPRDAARKLVGTMAHPLNRPQFHGEHGTVSDGYGILQPRVSVSLPSARRSRFVRIFAGESGIDPYTRAVSDVYQDIFQEGSFIGKGIYDVDAFERALDGRCPDNSILSHDLLESVHARSALVSDVELFEDHPSRYNVEMARRHRWIRGDWQIAQWLLPSVPGRETRRIANPLSGISLWKIFDNLRRSVVPLALIIFLIGHWLFLPALGNAGTMLIIAIVILPGFLSSMFRLLSKPVDLPLSIFLHSWIGAVGRQFAQGALSLVFLPYDAFVSADAIGKTVIRLIITKRRLLEWQTSSDSERNASADVGGFYAAMWIAPVIAIGIGASLVALQSSHLWAAIPFLCAWLISPWIAWWISLSIESPASELTAEQVAFLRVTARKTWRFFERFVTAEDHWLPPDNFQESPRPVIASRTSPTNMGMALLANLAARDFGYISLSVLLERTRKTLATMHDLERHRDHFYNWYDTRTLEPLRPLYISSVDSGNLAGHLLTLASGLEGLGYEPLFSPQMLLGLGDTVAVLQQYDGKSARLAQLAAELENPPVTFRDAYSLLERAVSTADEVAASLQDESDAIVGWADALKQNCEAHLEEMRAFAPCLALPPAGSSAEIEDALGTLKRPVSLRELASMGVGDADDSLTRWRRHARDLAKERLLAIAGLSRQAGTLAAMDFSFLYDPARDLFTIGFNVSERRTDASFYDLLASEARLGSYVAIALGQIPQDHWFSMGRLLVASQSEPILISWSGSMFEYLMPLLVMPSYENTLLDRTCKAVVEQQIRYGKLRGVPWGISESGYNRTDAQLNYQYRAFGVPGLGLKRGLAEDLVIAPYATAMALMVAPKVACENLQLLESEARSGPYGFYEAVDYTPSRLPPGDASATILSYMSHHQGMSLLALVYLLRDAPMQRRFLAYPAFKATDLLLQERVPRTAASVFSADLEMETSRTVTSDEDSGNRIYTDPTLPAPEVHLLSNGRYHVAISSAGGGYSRWGDLGLTRWREDGTRDCWGMFAYIRDVATGEFWSNAYQPTLRPLKGYEAIFSQARAEFRHRHVGLQVHTEVSVSPEDDVELRRITITNRRDTVRVIELTTFAEVVLATPASDAAHPAFSNLFVQTEFAHESSAVLCTRRARSEHERPPWLLHMMVGQSEGPGSLSCETDRVRFVGRGRTLANPAAMDGIGPLSNTVGSVLDPVVSLRRMFTLGPNETVIIDLILGAAESREGAMTLVERYQASRLVDRAFDLAWTHGRVTLHQLDATEGEARLYGRLAGALIYADPARRAAATLLRSNRRGQSGLWSYGISGDVPIVVLRIRRVENINIVRQLIRAHAYWRLKGLLVELVILNEDDSIYSQPLHEQITSVIVSGIEAQLLEKPNGIFVRHFDQIPNDDIVLLQSVARIVLDDEKGTLMEQWEHRSVLEPMVPILRPTRTATVSPPVLLPHRDLIFSNGLGGFTRDGHEYVITLQPGQMTPAPWVNVLANPYFGTVVSECGSAYTWFENAHEFRITPWSNDPVQDTTGEALYIRDEQTGQVWSPTPLPARGSTPYVIRHGFGYSVFEHTENGIESELWVFVAMDASVKFNVLKLRNVSGRPRRVSATCYCEWVLGELRHQSLLHVQTTVDIKTSALLARNAYNTEFPGRIVFLDVTEPTRTLTGDRKEFIGRNGSLAEPSALKHTRLSGKVGAGLDPCGAMQLAFDLADGQERETTFRLGVGRNHAEVQNLIQRFRRAESSRSALEGVWSYWNRTLGAVNVDTPDPAVNVMANGWLLYQTMSCRLWGRTGFYQSGGAYGFRDQLQDVMALVHAEPALMREHLLRAAARQFREGDVQHWWHPPAGRGVRTHFSDDYLWLPFVTCRYVSCVADTGVLDERVSFLESRPVRPEEEAFYDLPNRSDESATLYEHCVRSIENGLRFGEHGLPLMGCGDWNDGMNMVGKEGRGESVWLAFFLYDVLTKFSAIARSRQDNAFADRCLAEARQLKENIERNAWDGEWYRRAYFDNGDPLGSRTNPECQIDSLPQSWSVLSGAGDPDRSRLAMQSVELRLVRRYAGLIQLFDPPFDKSELNPGYIKGYIPGVRENGGQYTHGAIWTAMATAVMGESDRAWELFTLLNPIHHSSTPAQVATYKVEPYVIAADVYGVVPHLGRGGWTWYTGSASWMYRLLIETLLGVNREGDRLRLEPRMPITWNTYKIHYRFLQTVYHITFTRLPADSPCIAILVVDGAEQRETSLPLHDDGREHTVEYKFR